MRSSNYLSLAAAAILLLLALTAMESEAIRLDVQSRASVVRSNRMAIDKPGSEDVAVKASTSSVVGETKRSAAVVAAEEVRAVAHKLPEFHEDYYGPSDHSPRHH